ncbi:CG15056 [Drosophila busckii]|uniref:CG15056 n=2 Tax=Drosophila busckii TaxID=30019 RepID=A0A0M4EFV2_DROBS|nr:CG15056 [Drosophila busckii]
MQANIMMLNDDCFRVIFEMLSHVDRIKFARVCARFRDLYQDISPSLYKSVNCEIFQTMTLWEIRDFFTLSGCNIQQIRGSLKESSVRICTFMGWHCVNLKLLDISLTPLTLGSTYRLLSNLYYLESLRLDGCNLRNENLLAMRHLKQLKELDISRNYSLNGANMDQFPSSIESLTLTNCYNLLGFALPDFCSSLTNLKKMDIRGLVGIYASLENLINKNICTCLEELVFSDPAYESDYDHIAKLPSLKRITIQYEERYSKNSKFLYRLARHKANQLEYLEVIGANCITADDVIQISKLTALRSLRLINQASIDDRGLAAFGALKQLEQLNLTSSIHITNNGVLQLLLNCPKLQEVYVQHCRYLTDDLLRNFVRKAPEKVKNQHVLPIKLYIYGCKITEIGLHNDKVASKKYLDVSLIAPEYSLPDLADLLQLAYISDDEDDFLTDSFNSYDSDTPDSEFDHYDLGYIDYH